VTEERLPQEVIRINEQYYILASSSLADSRTRVLKNGEMFAVFDRHGDIQVIGMGEQGIFHEGTRYLSRLSLEVGGRLPLLLSSTVKEDNALLTVDLTNPDWEHGEEVLMPRGTLHIFRSKFLWDGVCYESIRFKNYGLDPVEFEFSLRFDADFADIFEVRGLHRPYRGRRLDDQVEGGSILLAYEGLDRVVRRTRIECVPPAQHLSCREMSFSLRLEPRTEREYTLTVACEAGKAKTARRSYGEALSDAVDAVDALRSYDATVDTSNEQFNEWVSRSATDLHMMITSRPGFLYPYAGVPWFSTPFGRDGIITALEYLWVNPTVAKGVLAYLASTQATEVNPQQDAEPGKILHEARKGEMAALDEHPFRRYYGSVDATPLFVMLAGAYYRRTGDLELIRIIWPNVERALGWIDHYGDLDGDGFVEYAGRAEKGLVHQGWKDSSDSVFHADGRLAEPPIALCEVQAYVYAAKKAAAELASALGDDSKAQELVREALVLQEGFERTFWSDELGTYVLALDGKKRPCMVRTSNAGHCLFAGIAGPEQARRTAEALLGSDMFAGWGIRTLSADAVRYNPMSYHNGSVWPHDNALIACGLARYGLKEHVARVLSGLFDAATFLEQHRLPELFCGVGRRSGEGPTLYPVACSPQAWASAAVFLLIQASLGLSIDANGQRICFHHPSLPESLQLVHLRNLTAGDVAVDLVLDRHRYTVGVNVLRRTGDVDIVAIK
jgi:glycogen debranching enzyme